MTKDHSFIIAGELGLNIKSVRNALELMAQGATIPFIARYRKEMTGSLDEVQLQKIKERSEQLIALDKRREAILESIKEQELLTDELAEKIENAATLSELEDLYLPYKPKKRTRAKIAREKGLEPLAKIIMSQSNQDPHGSAARFVNAEKEVEDEEAALQGARDIIAEWVNENEFARKRMRSNFQRHAVLKAKVAKGKEDEAKNYSNYFDWEESWSKAPSHRILAILRGEREGFLKVSVLPDEEKSVEALERIFVKNNSLSANQVAVACKDSYKRLLAPSLETEIRNEARERAEVKAIDVFSDNLRQLLLAPPLGQKSVLAIDPGFRTGCKVVCLDKQGNLKHNETIYPHPPQNERREALKKILSLVDAHNIEAIAIGNGTAGRETENMIRKIRFKSDIIALMVNESGASVYSASKVARDEFPQYDVTVRGAVSIGRRLMDPLAELVKIDPKSIGVGQYQHDVNQGKLQDSLTQTVESCVNSVGVDVNTASAQLLQHVSGLGPVLAQNIINHRKENGAFDSREELKNVTRFGDKAFQQAAGFLRIRGGGNVLDKSAVHPESYHIVDRMAQSLKVEVEALIGNNELIESINLQDYITDTVGLPTLQDILNELKKPGRDPRKNFEIFEFDKNVNRIEDLTVGMVLPGIVTNLTAFGAFVDVGVHQDGLVHISQITNRFIKDPGEVLSLNEKVMVKVIALDIDRRRINLSMKDVE